MSKRRNPREIIEWAIVLAALVKALVELAERLL